MKGGKTPNCVGHTRLSQVDRGNWRDFRFPQLLIHNEFEETFSFSASFPGQNFIKLFKCCSTTLTPQPSKTLESGFFFSSSRQLHFSKRTLLPDLLVYDNPSHKPVECFYDDLLCITHFSTRKCSALSTLMVLLLTLCPTLNRSEKGFFFF